MPKADRIFVTGATGFVGSAVARRLVQDGFSVRALTRHASPRAHIADLGLELVPGDLRDAASIRTAMAGCRYVFHVAADYRLWARDPDEIRASNITGTRTLMQEALRAGVERVVYTSSVCTLKLRHDRTPADETVSLAEQEAIGAYKRSKVAAERLVDTMVRDDGLPAVIVNPAAPIGPRDVRPTPTGRIVIEAASGRMPAFVNTGLNLVHVDDVADGHIAALRSGRIGERYILGGQNVLLSEMLGEIARLVGRRPPRLRLPWYAVVPVAHAAEALGRISGREPFVTRDGLRMARHHMFFSPAKAERELGVRARPFVEALEDAVRWFHDAGYLGKLAPKPSSAGRDLPAARMAEASPGRR
jgi:dihydroflavonol-4-reductase